MADIKIEHDGQEMSLSLDTIRSSLEGAGFNLWEAGKPPEGYVTQDTLNASISQRLKKERAKLSEDSDFLKEIFTLHGVPLDEEGKYAAPKPGKEVDVEKLKMDLMKQYVDPIKGQNDQLQQRVQALQAQRKRAEIVRAARESGLDETFLTVPEGAAGFEPVVNWVGAYFDFDPDSDALCLKGDNGEFKPSAKVGKPWADAMEFFESKQNDPAWKKFFRDDRPASSGYKGGSTPGRKREMTRDDLLKMSDSELQKHMRDTGVKLPGMGM